MDSLFPITVDTGLCTLGGQGHLGNYHCNVSVCGFSSRWADTKRHVGEARRRHHRQLESQRNLQQ